MTKAYKDMTLSELLLERDRLRYWIQNAKNSIGAKQNKKSLKRVNDLIFKLMNA